MPRLRTTTTEAADASVAFSEDTASAFSVRSMPILHSSARNRGRRNARAAGRLTHANTVASRGSPAFAQRCPMGSVKTRRLKSGGRPKKTVPRLGWKLRRANPLHQLSRTELSRADPWQHGGANSVDGCRVKADRGICASPPQPDRPAFPRKISRKALRSPS